MPQKIPVQPDNAQGLFVGLNKVIKIYTDTATQSYYCGCNILPAHLCIDLSSDCCYGCDHAP